MSFLVAKPEDRFSRDQAHFVTNLHRLGFALQITNLTPSWLQARLSIRETTKNFHGCLMWRKVCPGGGSLYWILRWAATWQNQQSVVCPAKTQISLGIRPVWSELKKAWVLSYPLSAQRTFWSDRADAQADPSLRWAHTHFVGFVVSQLKWCQTGIMQDG